MSDEKVIPPVPPSDPPPPPPPSDPPPAAAPPSGGTKSENGVMLVLSYLWILCLVPLLAEKDDKEVQWHAKHGLVWLIAEVVLYIGLTIVTFIPAVGCVTSILLLVLPMVTLIVRIIAIVKATKGERFLIPGVSDFVEKF